MCGIFGWDFPQGVNERRLAVLATALSYLNDLRGGHSWGTYSLDDKNVYRGLGDISSVAHGLTSYVHMMAHTRMASTGRVVAANAHPFEIGTLIGAHNGCIANHTELNRKYRRNFEVDSQHIFAHLAEGKKLDELLGWGTIEWVDLRDPGSVLLCKLSAGGALAVSRTAKVKGVVWSSTDEHLEKALESAALVADKVQIEPFVVYQVTDGEIFRTEQKLQMGEFAKATVKPQAGQRFDCDVLEQRDELWMLANEIDHWEQQLEHAADQKTYDEVEEQLVRLYEKQDELEDIGVSMEAFADLDDDSPKTRRNPPIASASQIDNPRALFAA